MHRITQVHRLFLINKYPINISPLQRFHNTTICTQKIENPKYEEMYTKPNLETIKNFIKLDNKMKSVASTLSQEQMENIEDNEKEYWPNKEKDLNELRTKTLPDLFSDDDDDDNKEPFVPFDVYNKDEDFAKTMAYLSVEHGMESPTQDEIMSKNEGELDYWPITEILRIARHTQITAAGRVYSFSAFVMIGNQNGCAGLGYGRGNTVPEAVNLAKNHAQKKLLTLDLWRGNNIGADFKERFKKSYVFMKARPPGSGRSCGVKIHTILNAFGINDVIVGWGGSTTKATLYKAVFKALKDRTRSPDKVSRMLGRKLFNRSRAFYYNVD